jgi:hypothetical protein
LSFEDLLGFFAGLSAMIQGAENGSNFRVKHYKESDAPSIFKEFFQEEL